MVSARAPCAISASISSAGTPAPPNPPISTVEPSRTPASAASTEGTILSTTPELFQSALEVDPQPQVRVVVDLHLFAVLERGADLAKAEVQDPGGLNDLEPDANPRLPKPPAVPAQHHLARTHTTLAPPP